MSGAGQPINGELHTFGEKCPTCGPLFASLGGMCAFFAITWRDKLAGDVNDAVLAAVCTHGTLSAAD